ncbi:MAG: alkaline phosphatase family protein [Bradymonadales bacterium]|nr:MAG: alkaline phosphatase family protein [Bradymonadales bacterium]
MRSRALIIALLILASLASFLWLRGLPLPSGHEYPMNREPVRVLLWMSIDGLRPDYVDTQKTPKLWRLKSESLWTGQLIPGFPTLTFPSHVSLSTGTQVETHGIPMNFFYDRSQQEYYSYPGDPALLQAEPIWTTATRQGLRVAVMDWVLSHDQKGENRAAYFNSHYRRGLSDRERLSQILRVFDRDRSSQPLQLLMVYAVGPDSLGHRYGPHSKEVREKMAQLDSVLQDFWLRLIEIWDRKMLAQDELIVMLTTDHGMAEIEFTVNFDALLGLDENFDIPAPTGGNIGQVFLDGLSEEARKQQIVEFKERMKLFPFVRVYEQTELPSRWGYQHPERVGDLVFVLEKGYAFARISQEVLSPVHENSVLKGMHGYDPEDPDMWGFGLVWRYPRPFQAENLGPVQGIRLHATVAELLGIEASPQAESTPIPLPQLN